jgi:hypothetical protein
VNRSDCSGPKNNFFFCLQKKRKAIMAPKKSKKTLNDQILSKPQQKEPGQGLLEGEDFITRRYAEKDKSKLRGSNRRNIAA